MTTKIRLINSMLATTGTASLSASDIRHPSYIKANALLTDVLEEFSSMELWFNTSIRTLPVNAAGKVIVPDNALTCDPTDQSKHYSIRNQYLWDNENYTDVIGSPVECIIIEQLNIEDMPPMAYQYLRAKARYEYFLDVDGSARKLQSYAQNMQRKYQEMIAMNMKLMDSNFFNSPAFWNFITRRRGRGGRGHYSGNGSGRDVSIGLLGNYRT